jgi:hypothetical protein
MLGQLGGCLSSGIVWIGMGAEVNEDDPVQGGMMMIIMAPVMIDVVEAGPEFPRSVRKRGR